MDTTAADTYGALAVAYYSHAPTGLRRRIPANIRTTRAAEYPPSRGAAAD